MRAGSGIVARLGTYVAVQGAPSRVEAVLGVKTTPMGAGEPIAIASLFLAEMARISGAPKHSAIRANESIFRR